MGNIVKIAGFTIRDQLRHKSFIIMLLLSILFILMVRGCSRGEYVANGQVVDDVAVAWHTSKIAFHIVAFGSMLVTIMLAMSIFSSDQENGSMIFYLAKPVSRVEYLCGRLGGIWFYACFFMVILHLTIFILAWYQTGGVIPGYLSASFICSLNLLFFVLCTSLLSFFMPDFIAALAAIGLGGFSFFSDSFYKLMENPMVKSVVQGDGNSEIALWRVIMPKTAMLQYYADTFISTNEFKSMGPIHPLMNVIIYTVVISILLIIAFNKKEV